jgi:hypothetical protein
MSKPAPDIAPFEFGEDSSGGKAEPACPDAPSGKSISNGRAKVSAERGAEVEEGGKAESASGIALFASRESSSEGKPEPSTAEVSSEERLSGKEKRMSRKSEARVPRLPERAKGETVAIGGGIAGCSSAPEESPSSGNVKVSQARESIASRLPERPEGATIVVGGGVAGCAAALSAARSGASVALLTKLPDPSETNTRYAQGGIIYTAPDDSPELLAADILAAGGGNEDAARTLALEGPPLVRRLLIEEFGVPFDQDADGFEGFHLTREGAHSVPRILHHRDTTGREIQLALASAVREEKLITVLPGMEAVELATTSDGRCAGVHAVKDGEAFAIAADSVVLATGGLDALYEHTTNPPGATGGGFVVCS